MGYKRVLAALAVVCILMVVGVADVCQAKPMPLGLSAQPQTMQDRADAGAQNMALSIENTPPPATDVRENAAEAAGEETQEEPEVKGVISREYMPLVAMLSCAIVIVASRRKGRKR